jgi:hypothetical protein
MRIGDDSKGIVRDRRGDSLVESGASRPPPPPCALGCMVAVPFRGDRKKQAGSRSTERRRQQSSSRAAAARPRGTAHLHCVLLPQRRRPSSARNTPLADVDSRGSAASPSRCGLIRRSFQARTWSLSARRKPLSFGCGMPQIRSLPDPVMHSSPA